MTKIQFASMIACYFSLVSCSTFMGQGDKSPAQEKRVLALEESVAQLKFHVSQLQDDNTLTKRMLAAIQSDLQSQNEELATQKKNVAILNRGLRSGVFEELPEDKINNAPRKLSSTMFPDFVNGRTGFEEGAASTNFSLVDTAQKNEDPIGPKELLATAEIKMNKAEYKDGLSKLQELKRKFPNFDDSGRSFLLSAQAWLKLKEFNNVFPELRNFYLRYPTSAELAYAKLLEGQANEGNGRFEKAATLYNEVISLSPQSSLAQSARDGMLRMRDQK